MKRYGASPARTYEFAADPGRTLDEIAADEETAGHTEGQLARDLKAALTKLRSARSVGRILSAYSDPTVSGWGDALANVLAEEPELLEQSDAGVDLTTGDVEVPDDPTEAV